MIHTKPYGSDPKPEKKKKKVTYKCSNGQRVTQEYIERKRKETYKKIKHQFYCQAYPDKAAVDHDHTVSQARCKKLNKTELIWDPDNIAQSSRLAHEEWERYRSGAFEDHANVKQRMEYVLKHDPETFEKRYDSLSDFRLKRYFVEIIHGKKNDGR